MTCSPACREILQFPLYLLLFRDFTVLRPILVRHVNNQTTGDLCQSCRALSPNVSVDILFALHTSLEPAAISKLVPLPAVHNTYIHHLNTVLLTYVSRTHFTTVYTYHPAANISHDNSPNMLSSPDPLSCFFTLYLQNGNDVSAGEVFENVPTTISVYKSCCVDSRIFKSFLQTSVQKFRFSY